MELTRLKAISQEREIVFPPLAPEAMTLLKMRYRKKDDKGGVVESPEGMFWRVARNIAAVPNVPPHIKDLFIAAFEIPPHRAWA